VFLSQALDPPQTQVVNRAMSLLSSIGACVEGERLTPLGQHLAALPVHVRIGKMLLYAAVFGCLEPVVSQSQIFTFFSTNFLILILKKACLFITEKFQLPNNKKGTAVFVFNCCLFDSNCTVLALP